VGEERLRSCVALSPGRTTGLVRLGISFVKLNSSGFVRTGLAGWTARPVFPPTLDSLQDHLVLDSPFSFSHSTSRNFLELQKERDG
jgi:hypothetical protein